jgi:hypothetical protein
MLSGANPGRKAANKGPEGGGVRGNMTIGNRVGEKLQSDLPCQWALLIDAQHHSLIHSQQRNQRFDAAPLYFKKLDLKLISSEGTKHNCQGRRGIAVDPENAGHYS